MSTVFVAVGAGFIVLFVVNALIRAAHRAEKIRFLDLFLIFAAALVLLAGLVVNSLQTLNDADIANAVALTALVLAVWGVILMLIEAFRPQRLRQSRGVLALGTALLLCLVTVGVPYISAYFALPVPASASGVAIATTPTTSPREDLRVAVDSALQAISTEIDATPDEILAALEQGQSVAQLVSANNGNLERVIGEITAIMTDFLETAAGKNTVERWVAAFGISQMENGVRFALNNDLETIRGIIGRNDRVPDGERFAFLTVTPAPTVVAQAATTTPSATALPPSPTREATVTPTDEPTTTPTATRTRTRYASPTPTLTPTLPQPCLASTLYNVNVRAEPDLESELVTTIPFETVVNVFGRNEEITWWFVEYEGDAGWVSREFVTTTTTCDELPVRE